MRDPSVKSQPAVTVAGCGAVTAVGHGVAALRTTVRANGSGLRPCSRFDSPRFQSSVVGAVPQNGSGANHDDPAHNLATKALAEAREQAHAKLQSIPAERIGLVLSTTKANIEALERVTDGRPCSDIARRHLQANFLAE